VGAGAPKVAAGAPKAGAAAGAAPKGLLVGAGCCCALKLKAAGCAAALEKLKPEVGC